MTVEVTIIYTSGSLDLCVCVCVSQSSSIVGGALKKEAQHGSVSIGL